MHSDSLVLGTERAIIIAFRAGFVTCPDRPNLPLTLPFVSAL